jgi:hypothetical protein
VGSVVYAQERRSRSILGPTVFPSGPVILHGRTGGWQESRPSLRLPHAKELCILGLVAAEPNYWDFTVTPRRKRSITNMVRNISFIVFYRPK